MVATEINKEAAKEEYIRRKMLSSFAYFFHITRPNKKYSYGKHTKGLLKELQAISERTAQGESSYTIINVPFRHGKSDVVSRRFPAWHLLNNPDHEVILGSYNYQLATRLSWDARKTFYKYAPYNNLGIQKDRAAIGSWKVARQNKEDCKGAMHSAGLGGTVTGLGGNIIIIDDYIKNREQAESEKQRDKIWASFESDFMTRCSPEGCAVIIVANRWHEDDLCGRIENANNPDHEDYNEKFPIFKIIKYPAEDPDTGEFLFLERNSKKWYLERKELLGSYAWAAMGNQNPRPRVGNLLKWEFVNFIDIEEVPKEALASASRGWDIASTEDEIGKADPDGSAGFLTSFYGGNLYLIDLVHGKWSTLKRNNKIKETAEQDTNQTEIIIETVAGYVDTYKTIKHELPYYNVRKFSPGPTTGDKVARATLVEPLFEAGKVYCVKAPWNKIAERQILSFPSGSKDDIVDALITSCYKKVKGLGRAV